jgi:uncharacterized protein YkwD
LLRSASSFGGKLKISKTLGATLLTAALVAGPVCAATASPAVVAVQSSPAASLDLFKKSDRQTIIGTFDGINAFRASKGLKPLKFNVTISTISQKWSGRMAATGDYRHSDHYVSGTQDGWTSASENIAWAPGVPNGQFFVDAWSKSPGHNRNMSRPGDNYMGIGISSRNGRTYATANHFSYPDGTVLSGSYNHPRDYFNGLPALDRITIAVPAAPVFFGDYGNYLILAQAGVAYSVGGKVVKDGWYQGNFRKIVVIAKAVPGYRLSGASSWSFDFRKAVTAVKPIMNSTTNRYAIPKQAGVAFFVNGKQVAAGTYKAANGKTLKFTAKASVSTVRLTGTAAWSFRF